MTRFKLSWYLQINYVLFTDSIHAQMSINILLLFNFKFYLHHITFIDTLLWVNINTTIQHIFFK